MILFDEILVANVTMKFSGRAPPPPKKAATVMLDGMQ